jgi:outer membrane protein assembly factor BamB
MNFAIANGTVYVGIMLDPAIAVTAPNLLQYMTFGLCTLDAITGASVWNYSIHSSMGSPAVANNIVYVPSFGYYGSGTPTISGLYAIDANGNLKWTYGIEDQISGSPTIYDGIVYVVSSGGNVYAIGNETVLTVSAPSVAAINKPFTLSGTLKTTDGTPIAGATIQLQKNVSGTWTDVAGKTDITALTGAYSISTSEPTVGTSQYKTVYAGNATYGNATSPVVSVKVVSKASVLADLNALKNTTSHLPNSAFRPDTKTALLSLLSSTELQVNKNNYGAAAMMLQKALLPHMSGCSATGRPDSNDWVRTCAAQGQLYPQVQNLIQELQALQGS